MHSSRWITFPIQLCRVLYSLYANLLHLLIMSLILHISRSYISVLHISRVLVSRTLLSIRVILINAFIWRVSSLPLISRSTSPLSEPLGTIPSAPTTTGITVTLMFDNFFRFKYFFSADFFYFHCMERRNDKLNLMARSFCWQAQGLVFRPELSDPFIYQNSRHFYKSHSLGWFQVCANKNWLHGQNSISWIIFPMQSRIIFPSQPCLILHSFCASLLHSLIKWFIVSSFSLHNLHLLFCCILSILYLNIIGPLWLYSVLLFVEVLFQQTSGRERNISFFLCLMIVIIKTAWNHWLQISIHAYQYK